MKKILIADDDTDIRSILRFFLEKEGYETHEAGDGQEAVEKIGALRPDLVVLDVMMPQKDGFRVCDQVKKDNDLKETKILMCSVRSFPSDFEMAQKVGVDAYICKPCEAGTLVDKVGELLCA